MLAGLIRPVGEALRNVRPGMIALASQKLSGWLPFSVRVSSPAFGEGQPMPVRCTGDGEGLCPPIRWETDSLPDRTRSLVLLCEDADVPSFRPLVHLIVHGIRPELGELREGEVPFRLVGRAERGFMCGRNSLARPGWTAPNPPPGHGPHRYAFQLFALDKEPEFRYPPGRSLLIQTIRPYLIGQGRLIGTYERA